MGGHRNSKAIHQNHPPAVHKSTNKGRPFLLTVWHPWNWTTWQDLFMITDFTLGSREVTGRFSKRILTFLCFWIAKQPLQQARRPLTGKNIASDLPMSFSLRVDAAVRFWLIWSEIHVWQVIQLSISTLLGLRNFHLPLLLPTLKKSFASRQAMDSLDFKYPGTTCIF